MRHAQAQPCESGLFLCLPRQKEERRPNMKVCIIYNLHLLLFFLLQFKHWPPHSLAAVRSLNLQGGFSCFKITATANVTVAVHTGAA